MRSSASTSAWRFITPETSTAPIDAYETALRIQPEYARAHRNLGVAAERRGDLVRAETHYRLAIRYDARMADAHRYLGDLLARQGRTTEAREAWQGSIDADPEQRAATALRRQIRSSGAEKTD